MKLSSIFLIMLSFYIALFPLSARAEKSSFNLLNFQAGAVSASQDSGGSSTTGQLSWNPNWSLSERFGVRGNVAGSLFNSEFDTKFGMVPSSPTRDIFQQWFWG